MKKHVFLMKLCRKTFLNLFLVLCVFITPFTAFAETKDIVMNPGFELPTLEQAERMMDNGLETAVALAELRRSYADKKMTEQRLGGKLFGTISYGYNDEPLFETSKESMNYQKLRVTSGVTFPLLGSFKKEKIAELYAKKNLLGSEHYLNMLSLDNLIALRKAYSVLWIEQQKEKVAQNFLTTEDSTLNVFENRQQAGLLLPSAKLDFLSVFQEVRRDIAYSKLRQAQALNAISLITGRNWDIKREIAPPTLPVVSGKNINIAEHPEAIYQLQKVEQQEKIAKIQRKMDREADITIGLNASKDIPGETGTGAYVVISIKEPFNSLASKKDQSKEIALQELVKARGEQENTILRLTRQAEEAYAANVFAAADVKSRYYNLLSATETIREMVLRHRSLPGDTFEKLQQSQAQYYRYTIEMLEQENLFLQSSVELVSFFYPGGIATEPKERLEPINLDNISRLALLNADWLAFDNNLNVDEILTTANIPTIALSDKPLIYFQENLADNDNDKTQNMAKSTISPVNWGNFKPSVYVWKAAPFLDFDLMKNNFDEISQAGFSRVLISLNGKEVQYASSEQGKNELDKMIKTANQKKLRVDLLLGDSSWILEEHRNELIELVKDLQVFEFQGIHLDLEPDSLSGAENKRPELLKELAQTIMEVQNATHLPVSISMHPRYLEGELGVLSRELFAPLQLEDIVVMLYSSNANSVSNRMAKIIQENKGLSKNISLAQSVEKSISQSESYAHVSNEQFENTLGVFENALYSKNGMKEIFIQSWEDFKENKK